MAHPQPLTTEFASAERSETEAINDNAHLISAIPNLVEHFDAIPSIVLILDKNRQIVFANSETVSALQLRSRESIYGLRPGEALNCIHADNEQIGCGTTSFCCKCGAVKAILGALGGVKAVEECCITPKGEVSPFDFRISSTPYIVGGERFVIFVVNDIGHEKRRQVLERTFFHDFSNTLGLVTGCSALMQQDPTFSGNKLVNILSTSVKMLTDEIRAQRDLLEAEDGQLSLAITSFNSIETLETVASVYQHHQCAKDKSIFVDSDSVGISLSSAKAQLIRVLGNMLKNSLEASSPQDHVSMGCSLSTDKRIFFWVKNVKSMPPDVQLQIFNRSFSTKGKGRGIGTYSIKLLTERYLKGRVSFSSSAENGTIFKISLPLHFDGS